MMSKIGEYTNRNTPIHLRTQSQAASKTLPDQSDISSGQR